MIWSSFNFVPEVVSWKFDVTTDDLIIYVLLKVSLLNFDSYIVIQKAASIILFVTYSTTKSFIAHMYHQYM